MSRLWRWVLPCYLFTLPMTIVGWTLAVVFYKAHSWAWYDGVFTCVGGFESDGTTRIWGKPNAQTLGWLQIYDADYNRWAPDLRVHETVHVVQAFAGSLAGLAFCPVLFALAGWSPWLGLALGGFIGGFGFALLYGILFVYLLLKQRTGWYNAYMANPFEIQAYAVQDRYVADIQAGRDSKPWGV